MRSVLACHGLPDYHLLPTKSRTRPSARSHTSEMCAWAVNKRRYRLIRDRKYSWQDMPFDVCYLVSVIREPKQKKIFHIHNVCVRFFYSVIFCFNPSRVTNKYDIIIVLCCCCLFHRLSFHINKISSGQSFSTTAWGTQCIVLQNTQHTQNVSHVNIHSMCEQRQFCDYGGLNVCVVHHMNQLDPGGKNKTLCGFWAGCQTIWGYNRRYG